MWIGAVAGIVVFVWVSLALRGCLLLHLAQSVEFDRDPDITSVEHATGGL